MISWSDEQKKVIETRNADILVSAAAGSGKTAVLVERIVGLICDDGMSFDELIVMTFTKAAAAEMRERIEKALYKRYAADPHNTHLALQLNCIPRARIATIDSICQTLIKQYYQYLDIDPNFRVADESELAVMKSDIIDELLEEYYERADDDFMRLADTFSRKTDDSSIKGLIDRLYTFAESKTFPEHFLNEQREESIRETEGCYEESGWYVCAVDMIHKVMHDYEELLTAAQTLCDGSGGPYKYADVIDDCLKKAGSIADADSYDDIKELTDSMKFMTLPRFGKKDEVDPVMKENVQAAINSFKNYVSKTLKSLMLLTPDELKASTAGSAALGKTIIELTAEFMRRFDAVKREANIVDFADMEHLALKLLYDERDGKYVPSGIADELAAQLKEIMIDEYQDSNGVQEDILYALSAERFGRPDVFMVGDVKQSIYRFRQADPGIFIGKYDSYSHSGDKILIELNANYRSRSEVVYSTNAVFDRAMRRELGGVEYDAGSRLNAKASYTDNMIRNADGDNVSACSTEMLIADCTKPVSEDDKTIADTAELYADTDASELKDRELEFAMIAKRINELVNRRDPAQSFRLQDSGTGGLRPAGYRDIAILVRKKTNGYAEKLTEVLEANGIPSVYDKATGFYSAAEVRLMLSMLSIIDNPRQDIPLAAVMRSPMFGFSDDELAFIKAEYDGYLSNSGDKVSVPAAEDALSENMSSEEKNAGIAAENIADNRPGGNDAADAGGMHEPESSDTPDAVKDAKTEAIGRIKAALHSDFWDAVRYAAAENAHAAAFTAAINRYRELADVLPVHMLLERIYDETGYYDYVTAMPLGDIRRRNLELLSGRAESYAGTGMLGLYNFTRYVEALQNNKRDESSSQSSDEHADCVKIVTIHGSKGLEYPIVFVAGCSDPDTDRNGNADILADNELGIASDYTDIESGIVYPGFKKAVIRMKNREEDIGERQRLLYVAMTRAKEKLIICGRKKGSAKEGTVAERIAKKAAEGSLFSMSGTRNGKLPKRMLEECSNYLDMMLLAAGEDRRAFDISIYTREELVNAAGSELLQEIGARGRTDAVRLGLEGDADSDYAARLREMLSAGYAFEAETRLKPKLSVSEIKALAYGDESRETAALQSHKDADADDEPQMYNASEQDPNAEYYVDYDDISAEYGEYAESDNVDTSMLKHVIDVNKSDLIAGEGTDNPESRNLTSAGGIGSAGSPANRGTAFHRAVELTNFSLNAQENLQYLAKCGRMTETELRILDRDAYISFMSSELAGRMAEADREGRLRREQHFMVGMPARRLIASQDSDDLQLLQGITDAYITERDGSITLIDYKTDRTSDEEELKSRYRLQLELYAEALGQLTGCEVRQKIIYSTFMKRQIML